MSLPVEKTAKICLVCYKKFYGEIDEHNSIHMVEIIPHLFLGAEWNAYCMEELMYFKINSIYNVAYEVVNKFHDAFQYKKLMWNDEADFDILTDMVKTVDLIHEDIIHVKNVLVHCYLGRSRSVALTMAYLVKYHKKNVDDALTCIQSCKKDTRPNVGFMTQLEIFYKIVSSNFKPAQQPGQ